MKRCRVASAQVTPGPVLSRAAQESASLDAPAAVEDDADGFRIETMLFDQDARRQQVHRVVVAHRDGGLEHDRAAVELAR